MADVDNENENRKSMAKEKYHLKMAANKMAEWHHQHLASCVAADNESMSKIMK
jgi:hypothetical protein